MSSSEELFEESTWEAEGGFVVSDPEPDPEPESAGEDLVYVKYTRPGSVVLEDGRSFTYNKPRLVTKEEAEYLTELTLAGSPQFVYTSS